MGCPSVSLMATIRGRGSGVPTTPVCPSPATSISRRSPTPPGGSTTASRLCWPVVTTTSTTVCANGPPVANCPSISSLYVPVGTLSSTKRPSVSVTARNGVPTTMTSAPATGCPAVSCTTPCTTPPRSTMRNSPPSVATHTLPVPSTATL